MASASVWENVFLSITPTLDGVCRMLWFIILDGFVCQILTYMSFLLNVLAELFRLFCVTDVIVTFC